MNAGFLEDQRKHKAEKLLQHCESIACHLSRVIMLDAHYKYKDCFCVCVCVVGVCVCGKVKNGKKLLAS